jgi:hypothetical protein
MNTAAENKVGLAIVTGQKQYAGVGDGRKFHITDFGIEFVGKMDFDQWRELMHALKKLREVWDLCAGTAVRYGLKNFGREKVEETLSQCEFDHLTAMRSLALGQLELEFSDFTGLSAEHYFVLTMAFPGEDQEKEIGRWAALANKNNMSPVLLKRSIEAGKVLDPDEAASASGRGSGGLGFLEGLGFAFNQWQRRIGGKQAIMDLDRDSKVRWLDSVKPVVELAKEVEGTL